MSFNIQPYLQELTELRHQLHRRAELSGAESETARLIHDFLKETDPDEIQKGIGGHGILATYQGGDEGPHILLRCELDALPIRDEIENDYRSESEEVGHKCGHDGHMSIICGVARLLAEERPAAGAVTLLFQPAEETGQGARQVLRDEAFQALSPDFCFALHNLPGYENHQVIIRDGIFAAASVGLEARFEGKTAHSAHPEEGRSPAMAMAQLIEALSSVPQFYSSLDEPTKVTVINAVLGEYAFGTSPARATVRATLRTYDDDVLDSLRERCLAAAEGLAGTYGLAIDHTWAEPFAATVNDGGAADIVRKAARQQGFDILEKNTPFGWSEDFGLFTKEIPGAIFGLGIGREHPALHSELYDFPDELIATGTLMFMQIINEILFQG
ncbi:amidohydrolase [Fodinibius roseus]|uniref:Amidohydrolase n=1 Tax=Fodinibius roseus TaxID=1194090 RepID=A0A1M4V937_9BACT|nr:amidohydrolase [Fodinibius roseus]SHE65506.1 amidohydrolase [Fodinibius roseus]